MHTAGPLNRPDMQAIQDMLHHEERKQAEPGLTLTHASRDQQMLEKKVIQDREASAAREADISMEMERQRAVLAAQVLNSPSWRSTFVHQAGCLLLNKLALSLVSNTNYCGPSICSPRWTCVDLRGDSHGRSGVRTCCIDLAGRLYQTSAAMS